MNDEAVCWLVERQIDGRAQWLQWNERKEPAWTFDPLEADRIEYRLIAIQTAQALTRNGTPCEAVEHMFTAAPESEAACRCGRKQSEATWRGFDGTRRGKRTHWFCSFDGEEHEFDPVQPDTRQEEYRVAFSAEYGNWMVIDSEHGRHAQSMERADAELLADAMNARAAGLVDTRPLADEAYSESPEMVAARDSLTIYYHGTGCPSHPPDNGNCTCGLTAFVDEIMQASYAHGREAVRAPLEARMNAVLDEAAQLVDNKPAARLVESIRMRLTSALRESVSP